MVCVHRAAQSRSHCLPADDGDLRGGTLSGFYQSSAGVCSLAQNFSFYALILEDTGGASRPNCPADSLRRTDTQTVMKFRLTKSADTVSCNKHLYDHVHGRGNRQHTHASSELSRRGGTYLSSHNISYLLPLLRLCGLHPSMFKTDVAVSNDFKKLTEKQLFSSNVEVKVSSASC